MKKFIWVLSVLSLLSSCQNNEKIAQLEKEKAELELQKAQIEQSNQKLLYQNQELERQNRQLSSRKEELERKHEEEESRRVLFQNTWQRYGTVTLYEQRKEWFGDNIVIERAGEGTVYVKQSQLGAQYELRYQYGNESYSYHVALGHYTLTGSNSVKQFSAHAGEYYFDL